MISYLNIPTLIQVSIRELKFILVVCTRSLSILFRKKKGIELIQLCYTKKDLFENSYAIISFNFKNVLWYDFKGIKKTTRNGTLVLDIEKLSVTPIRLLVVGLIRQETFKIEITPNRKLESTAFKVSAKNISTPKQTRKNIELKGVIPTPIPHHPKLNPQIIHLTPVLYNIKHMIWKKEITINFPSPQL